MDRTGLGGCRAAESSVVGGSEQSGGPASVTNQLDD